MTVEGTKTVLQSASSITITATTHLTSTLPASTATVTQRGSTIYRDITVASVSTLTAGQTVTISGSTSVLPTRHVTTVNVTVVTSYCPPGKSTPAALPRSTTSALKATAYASPPTPLPVPSILPKCLKDLITGSQCASTTNCDCYCKSAAHVSSIIQCIASSGGSKSDISRAVAYFQGICAPYVPHNPAIITAVPSTVTRVEALSENCPYTTVTLLTAVTEACTLRACKGPSTTRQISTCITAPAVSFGADTSGYVPLVPVTETVTELPDSTPKPSAYNDSGPGDSGGDDEPGEDYGNGDSTDGGYGDVTTSAPGATQTPDEAYPGPNASATAPTYESLTAGVAPTPTSTTGGGLAGFFGAAGRVEANAAVGGLVGLAVILLLL